MQNATIENAMFCKVGGLRAVSFYEKCEDHGAFIVQCLDVDIAAQGETRGESIHHAEMSIAGHMAIAGYDVLPAPPRDVRDRLLSALGMDA